MLAAHCHEQPRRLGIGKRELLASLAKLDLRIGLGGDDPPLQPLDRCFRPGSGAPINARPPYPLQVCRAVLHAARERQVLSKLFRPGDARLARLDFTGRRS